jgi:hypothetical protein
MPVIQDARTRRKKRCHKECNANHRRNRTHAPDSTQGTGTNMPHHVNDRRTPSFIKTSSHTVKTIAANAIKWDYTLCEAIEDSRPE